MSDWRQRSYEIYESGKYSNVYFAMRPMFIVSKIAGLGPFELIIDKQGQRFSGLRPSTYASAYSLILIVVVIGMFAFDVFYFITHLHAEMRTVLFIPSTLSMICTHTVVVVSIALSLFRTKVIILKIMILIERVDEVIGLDILPHYKKAKLISVISIVLSLVYLAASCFFNMFLERKWFHKIAHFCVIAIVCIIVLQYLHMVVLLEYSFFRLNSDILFTFGVTENEFYGYELDKLNHTWKKLEEIEVKRDTSSRSFFPSRGELLESGDRLRDLRSLYVTLCHVGRLISSAYGMQILLALTQALVSSVGYTFTIIIDNFEGTGSIIDWLGLSMYLTLAVIEVLCISVLSHRALTQADRTPGLVHHLLLYNPVNKGLLRFSYLLLHFKLKLSPGGLLPLNNTLMVTFFNSFTTYSMILWSFLTSEREL